MADPKFESFMGAVLAPIASQMTQHERIKAATCVADLTDSDLLHLLRHAMLQAGVTPLSEADNIHAHLRERAARREAADADDRSPLERALEVVGRALAPLEEIHRKCICAGLAILPEHLEDAGRMVSTIEAFARLCTETPEETAKRRAAGRRRDGAA